MDDTIEEHKLLNQLSEQARLKELAAGGQLVEHENNSVQELEEKAQGSVELKEIIKAERDQKVIIVLIVLGFQGLVEGMIVY